MQSNSAHSRLLYIDSKVSKFSLWMNHLSKIDQAISQSLKFHLANDDLTFYFFGHEFREEGTFWQGREVIGFESSLPDGLKVFDSFAGEMHSFNYDGVPKTIQSIFDLGREYAAQIPGGGLLASTWCLRLKGIDHGKKASECVLTPSTVFQFFKKT